MKNLCLYDISLCVVKCLLRAKEGERKGQKERERKDGQAKRESKRRRGEERDSKGEIHKS